VGHREAVLGQTVVVVERAMTAHRRPASEQVGLDRAGMIIPMVGKVMTGRAVAAVVATRRVVAVVGVVATPTAKVELVA
jgi:hypothetical protein